jgi:hypothetical protein
VVFLGVPETVEFGNELGFPTQADGKTTTHHCEAFSVPYLCFTDAADSLSSSQQLDGRGIERRIQGW